MTDPIPPARSGAGQPLAELQLHVDPQFVHRPLAAQALGVEGTAPIEQLADRIIEAAQAQQLPDVRVAVTLDQVPGLVGGLASVRGGFYFKQAGKGAEARYRFHDTLPVEGAQPIRVEGEFDPARFEASSAATNLSGRTNVYLVALVRDWQPAERVLVLRPLLIGFPYYSQAQAGSSFRSDRPELHAGEIDQFHLDEAILQRRVSPKELQKLFELSEQQVKEAFAEILGLSSAPADWGGETSDLVADVTVNGVAGRCAIALKGPGGRPKPWTLYPNLMGKRGDQAMRLFTESADIMAVQHCNLISGQVRHLMDALATFHRKRYLLIHGDDTVRILKQAGLFG